jgi:hypothetical protein
VLLWMLGIDTKELWSMSALVVDSTSVARLEIGDTSAV